MKRLLAIPLTIAAVLVTAGCVRAGTPTSAPSTPASPITAPPAYTPTPSSSRSDVPLPAASCGHPTATQVELTDRNGPGAVCVALGGRVEVYLRGADDDRWSAIRLDGTALEPAPNGKRALQLGVTAGFYAAVRTGISILSSTRDGRVWQITVVVG